MSSVKVILEATSSGIPISSTLFIGAPFKTVLHDLDYLKLIKDLIKRPDLETD